MSGLTELLLIFAIILGILLVPKRLRRPKEGDIRQPHPWLGLTGWHRVAIVASILWPGLLAFYLEPWNTGWLVFLSIGIFPVGLAWGIYWALSGFRKT
jgi:hypothetical protein